MNPFNKAFSWPLQWNRNYLYGKWTNNMTWVHSSHHLVWHKEFLGFLRIPCNRMRWFIFTSYSVHEYSNFMQIGALSHITSFQSTPPPYSPHTCLISLGSHFRPISQAAPQNCMHCRYFGVVLSQVAMLIDGVVHWVPAAMQQTTTKYKNV